MSYLQPKAMDKRIIEAQKIEDELMDLVEHLPDHEQKELLEKLKGGEKRKEELKI